MDSNKDKPSVLKSTREARGLTIEIVHEATKIPMDALRAIEEGYSVRILSPFYYRGFIKIYAEFLGLDVGEMYKQYGLDQPVKPASVVTAATSPAAKPIAKPKPVRKISQPQMPQQPNVVLGQVQNGFTGIFKPKNIMLVLKVIAFLFLLFLLVKMTGCIASHLNKKAVTAPKNHSALKMTHESVQAPSADNKVEVAVRAAQDIWLLVKADGNIVYETTLSKGSMESWTADNRIELSGRDIEMLDMEVNNKQIGFLGGGDRRIRKVLITQEGLTVKK